MNDFSAQVTRILQSGDDGKIERLFPLVYDELRGLAGKRMSSEREGHTLQATALVNEAYMRLVRDRDMKWSGRRHFFGAAAQAIRRILVDHARRVHSEKRGGDVARLTITLSELADPEDPERMLALDSALESLEIEDPRAAEVVRLRFFAGLDVKDTALALGVVERTVIRDWVFARARLASLLSTDAG